jgi:hypothetical protein
VRWAGTAHAGEEKERGIRGAGPRAALGRGKKERERGPAGKERRGGMLGWDGRLLGWAASFYSFFLFFFPTLKHLNHSIGIQINLNSNPTQIKQCTSMNAQTCCSYIKFYFLVFLITLNATKLKKNPGNFI